MLVITSPLSTLNLICKDMLFLVDETYFCLSAKLINFRSRVIITERIMLTSKVVRLTKIRMMSDNTRSD